MEEQYEDAGAFDTMMSDEALALMALMTLAMLLVYMWTGLLVGRARKQMDVPAPATQGPDAFNRLYRAHVNTLEQLVLALPSFWIFNLFESTRWTALLMMVWCAGRIVYVLAYIRDADRRSTGFMISFVAMAIAMLGSVYFAVDLLFSA
jgi:glutathione S-transferase